MNTKVIITFLAFLSILSCNRKNGITNAERIGTEIDISCQTFFNGSIKPLASFNYVKLPDEATTDSVQCKTSALISFSKSFAVALNYSPYMTSLLSSQSDSAFVCALLAANSAAFFNRQLDSWDTLVSALHSYSMVRIADIRTMEKDGDSFVKGHIKVLPGRNLIMVGFIDQSNKLIYTSVAEYIYMDASLEILVPAGETWKDGFVKNENGSIWLSGRLRSVLYPAKEGNYAAFPAYSITGIGIAGVSEEYAAYKCANPDSSITPSNPVPPPINSNLPTWKAMDSVPLLPASTGNPSIIFKSISDTMPYIACIDSLRNNAVIVLRKTNSGWDTIGTTPQNVTSYAIAAPHNDTIYLAFTDNSNSGKISVWKYGGTTWEVMGSAISGSTASAISMSFTAPGIPCIAFSDHGRAGKVTLLKFNSISHSFESDTTIPENSPIIETAIAVTIDSKIHVAVVKSGNGQKLSIYTSGSTWTHLDTALTNGTGIVNSLSLTGKNSLYVSYVSGESAKYAYLFHKTLTDTVFTSVASPISAESSLSFAISPNSASTNMFMAYRDSRNHNKGSVRLSGSSNDSWRLLGSSAFTYSAVNSISAGISGSDVPWVITHEGNRFVVYRYGL